MNERVRHIGGSRYLYESFDVNAARIEAVERVSAEKWIALEQRLSKIEDSLDRLERRIWVAVFGIVASVMGQWVSSVVVYGS